MNAQQILAHFRTLDTQRKLEVLERLWEETSADPEAVPVTDAQRQLLDERLRQHDE